MIELPEPLTPSDCDLTGFPFMPLECLRLLDSDFAALSTGDEFKAAVLLWAKAWTQVPAASIPDDDRILAKWLGLSVQEWRAVKDNALNGFVRCSDGRMYHAVVAEKALQAFDKRRKQSTRAIARWKKEKGDAVALPAHKSGTRAARMADAKAKGTHTGLEWELLRAVCGNRCVRCGSTESIEKDHITPICQGGDDSIENLQPLCALCNSSKGGEAIDFRPADWRQECRTYATALQERGRGRGESESSTLVGFENPTPEGEVLSFADRLNAKARTAPLPSKPKSKRATECPDFDGAWKAWPQKGRSSKAKALKLWLASRADAETKAIAVTMYLRSKDATKDGGAFVPAFERWLRDRLDSWLEQLKLAPASATVVPIANDKLPSSPQWWADAALAAKNYDPKFWTGYASRCMPDREAEAPTLIAPSDLVRERVELRFRMIGLEQIKIRTQAPEAAR